MLDTYFSWKKCPIPFSVMSVIIIVYRSIVLSANNLKPQPHWDAELAGYALNTISH